jgi:hypothetical protein
MAAAAVEVARTKMDSFMTAILVGRVVGFACKRGPRDGGGVRTVLNLLLPRYPTDGTYITYSDVGIHRPSSPDDPVERRALGVHIVVASRALKLP